MKTLQKTYTGKYAPNHLEFDYWIDLTADAKGSVIKTYSGMGWTEISGNSGGSGGSGMSSNTSRLLISILRNGVYDSDMSSAINDLEKQLSVQSNRTLISISALYSGGEVPVGTAVDNLKDLVVTAHYSDGTKEDITNYTILGEIVKGDNTITVEYQGKTATFVVVGISVELTDVALGASVSFESSNGMTISNRTDRATALPVGQYLTKGKTYNFSLGEFSDDYSYGIQIMVVSSKGLVFEIDDIEGIQYFPEVSSRELDSGWLTADYQYPATKDNRILCINFKKNAGGNFSETDRINLINNFKIEEV